MKKIQSYCLLSIVYCLLLILPYSSRATHIIGGAITYELIDTNNYIYKVTIKVYLDCYSGQAPFDNPLCLSVFNGANNFLRSEMVPFPGSDTLSVTDVNDTCLWEIPDDVCVEEAIYVQNVTLPPGTGGYHLSYQRCCRNNSILNLVNPGGQGATYTAFIPDISVAQYNSNPAFNNFPPILVCVDAPLEFDHSATDIDGDSLVYELCTPYHGGSATPPPGPRPCPAAALA